MKLSILFLCGLANASVIIPEPAGPYGVSLVDLQLVDTNRTDPYTGAPNRTLPISLIKPIESSLECQHIRQMYMPNATANYLEQSYGSSLDLPLNNTFSQVELSLCKPVYGYCSQHFPLVFFSPGAGTPRQLCHVLCTNIASQGYNVITVDSPGEPGSFITYLDGSTEYGTNATVTDDAAVEIRVQDIGFILDQVSSKRWPHGKHDINTSFPIVFGHSFGGNAATSVVIDDKRFVGGANLDGGIDGTPLNHTTSSPFLIFASDMPGALQHNQSTVRGWSETWRNLLGPKWQLQVKNSTHDTFTDVPVIGSLLGLYSISGVTTLLGSILPSESLDIQVSVLSTLFKHLSGRGNVESIIEVARTFPEVVIVNATDIG